MIHLINYNTYPDGESLIPDENLAVQVPLPEGKRVASARVLSPDWEGYARETKAGQENGAASLKLDRPESYAVFVLELKTP